MKGHRFAFLCQAIAILALPSASSAGPEDWLQWGSNPQHTGFVRVDTRVPNAILSDTVVDPNALASYNEVGGDLLAHYQVPLVHDKSVYMELKGNGWTSLETWDTQGWGMQRLDWKKDGLQPKWTRTTDWTPVPFGVWDHSAGYWIFLGPDWEPVFHGALDGRWVYVPASGGSLLKVDKETGAVHDWIRPFGPSLDPTIYLCGPVTTFKGNVYYNAIQLDPLNPWTDDVVGSWLVRVAPDGKVTKVSYASLTPDAPAGSDPCTVQFGNNSDSASLPWPPSPGAVANTIACGTQRAALNLAPAVAPDGTVYTASRAHRNDRFAYLIAVKPDLSLKWAASLRGRLNDGCDVGMPPNGSPGGCTAGATAGVDPATNELPAGRILDDSSGSPTVAPDGTVLFGTYARYNFAQGHLMRFDRDGQFLGAFGFGWDMTAGIFPHGHSYSIVFKENHYGDVGSYCNVDSVCPSDRTATYPSDPESYFVTQLSPSLVPEWRWQNTNTESCVRNPDTTISCVSDHPNGFEFCVNHVAIDRKGVVYANSEDGNLYVIGQGGTLVQSLFLNQALGAAYTPVSIGHDGKVYSQNFGHMIVVGKGP